MWLIESTNSTTGQWEVYIRDIPSHVEATQILISLRKANPTKDYAISLDPRGY